MRAVAALVTLALCAGSAAAQGVFAEPRRPTPFDQGRKHLYLGVGSEGKSGEHYWGVGAGIGYYVVDGLEASLFAAYYWGDGPSVTRVTPELRYVAQPLLRYSPVVPYLGASVSEYFIDDANSDSAMAVGGHAGIAFVQGYFVAGLGIGVEHFLDCTRNCTAPYPEFTISLPF